MPLIQNKRLSADNLVREDLSLAQTSTNQSHQALLTCDGMHPYISEVSRIRIMRELYKKETQKYINDDLRNLLENEKITKLQTANKLKLLVEYNKSILNNMDKERNANAEMIKELVKMSNNLNKNSNNKEQHQLIILADAAIKNLLSDNKQ